MLYSVLSAFCDHRFRIKNARLRSLTELSPSEGLVQEAAAPVSCNSYTDIVVFNIGFLYAAFDMVAYRLGRHYAEEKNKLVWITFCMRGYATAAPPCLMDMFWQQSVTKYWTDLLQNYTDSWWLKKNKILIFVYLVLHLISSFLVLNLSNLPYYSTEHCDITLTLFMSPYCLRLLYKVALFCCSQRLLVRLFTPVRSWIKSYGRLSLPPDVCMSDCVIYILIKNLVMTNSID